MNAAINCGDFVAARIVLLGSNPTDAPVGLVLRSLWVFADPVEVDPANYWILEIGRMTQGSFRSERVIPFASGFPGTATLVSLTPGVRVQRGDLMALRVAPTGDDAEPLTGLSVVPEYAIVGERAR